jgi:dTDP-4-amino-4,6-dideoxygalactose transaminase
MSHNPENFELGASSILAPFTVPFLPPLAEYVQYLEGVWDRQWLTNQGELSKQLESSIQKHLNLSSPAVCAANAGLLLQIALHAFGIKGEVITTPFTYIATASCPLWEGCDVLFADIERDSLNLDPAAAEAAITPRTEAIIATHVFGNPCDVDAFEQIGRRHGIPIIYDAAHAFGVNFREKSLLEYGDASILSLHATKLFHAVEGGIFVSPHQDITTKVEWMRRYGHNGNEEYHGVGINAKISELHAAMGLCVLKHFEEISKKRFELVKAYDEQLIEHPHVRFAFDLSSDTEWNASYYPVIFSSEDELHEAVERLTGQNICPRRYFYPGLNSIPALQAMSSLPVVDDVAKRILALPLYHGMAPDDVDRISSLL